jgi:hypothetical protein
MWLELEQNYNIDAITKMEDELRMKANTLVSIKDEAKTQSQVVK